MNEVLFYGGVGLSILLFVMAVVLLFHYRIPAAFRFLAHTGGRVRPPARVRAQADEADMHVPQADEYYTSGDTQTTVIDITDDGADIITLVDGHESSVAVDDPNLVLQGITEVLEPAAILPNYTCALAGDRSAEGVSHDED